MKNSIHLSLVTIMASLMCLPMSWGRGRGVVDVEGKVEGEPFHFSARRINGLMNQCLGWYEVEQPYMVDDISVSVDSGRSKNLFNRSSYWRSAAQVCSQITSYVLEVSHLGTKTPKGNLVVGEIEGTAFIFKGKGEAQIFDACENFYDSEMYGTYVNEIYVSVNGAKGVKKTSGFSYWRDAYSVCKVIAAELDDTDDDYDDDDSGGYDPPPISYADCDGRPHNSRWFERLGSYKETLSCPRGQRGRIIVKYAKRVEYRCDDGIPILTGRERKGRELSKENRCKRVKPKPKPKPRPKPRPQPKMCQAGKEFTQIGYSRTENEVDSLCRVRAPKGTNGQTLKLNSIVGQGTITIKCSGGRWKKVSGWCKPDKFN